MKPDPYPLDYARPERRPFPAWGGCLILLVADLVIFFLFAYVVTAVVSCYHHIPNP